jgi:putative restriction endonuclease
VSGILRLLVKKWCQITINSRPLNDGKPWVREQLILAFELYCRIPFQKTKASNPQVKQLATLLYRTPAAVARKLGNFGAFDPQLKKQHITGLTHTSRLDREIWDEFQHDWGKLVIEAHKTRSKYSPIVPDELVSPLANRPSERTRPVKQRLHQAFFRDAVLSSYNSICCITGLPIAECLIASHIVPWSKDEKLRVDPTNGLCLSATFDKLFDRGMITISEDLTVIVAKRVRYSTNPIVREEISKRHDQPIIRPVRFLPNPNHLKWHNENVFDRS